MGNIRKILLAVRKFTPEGQDIVMNILKGNREFLKSREYAFAELPRLLSNQGKTKEIEELLINPNNSIRDIIVSLLKTKRHKVNISTEHLRLARNYACINFTPTQFANLNLNFAEKKNAFINLMKTESEQIKYLADFTEDIKHPFDLQNSLNCILNIPDALYRKGEISLKEAENLSLKTNEIYIKALQLITGKSSNPKICRIENLIKEKFKLKQVFFEDEECAENMYKAIKIAKKGNIPLPDNIIISSNVLRPFNMMHTDGSRSIILKPSKAYNEFDELVYSAVKDYSGKKYPTHARLIDKLTELPTNNSVDIYLHELIHMECKDIELLYREISGKYKGVANRLCTYSSLSDFKQEEIRTMLKTKYLLERLKPTEETLFNVVS